MCYGDDAMLCHGHDDAMRCYGHDDAMLCHDVDGALLQQTDRHRLLNPPIHAGSGGIDAQGGSFGFMFEMMIDIEIDSCSAGKMNIIPHRLVAAASNHQNLSCQHHASFTITTQSYDSHTLSPTLPLSQRKAVECMLQAGSHSARC